ITDVRMTRFMITLREAVLAVQTALSSHSGGNIFVKKIPSMKVTDIAEALFPGRPKEIVGIRPGEKLHEQMVSPEEASRTINSGGFYIIRPEINAASLSQQENHEQSEFADCKYVDDSFSYASNTNSSWMTHSELVDWVVANKHSYV
ncbi:MAG: polysaccharide biosynthesis protein, partial [Thalassolituus sp.]